MPGGHFGVTEMASDPGKYEGPRKGWDPSVPSWIPSF
jgi:hypothetical protein